MKSGEDRHRQADRARAGEAGLFATIVLAMPICGIVDARGPLGNSWLMAGIPDYETSVTHRQATHPDQPGMTCQEGLRERREARYALGKGRLRSGG